MKTLTVPKQHISQCETVFDCINLLHEAGAEARIDQVNWKKEFPKSLPVTVRVAHDGEKIYLYYEVTGEEIRAENTKDFGSVWEDSCVEFFMQRDGEKIYRNFECNVLGALLAARHETREKSERLTEHMSSITRFSTIKHRYENHKQVSDWTMYLAIPKQAMGFAPNESLSGQKIRANFYKCGDKTPETHFISWNPIDLPKPNFHVPQFFGLLNME
ncbi:carbohydrate-binding family 9-like protein [Petrimonas sp.]|uniref:carbohydrate-binding family 9-like protein n=1 Tax=Petrimonas sp. TaxID=2023866 RepID=UPI003F50F9D3